MYYIVKYITKDNYEYHAGPFSYNMAESYINDNGGDSDLCLMGRVVDGLKEI
jgi:hypothetical protein